MKRWMASDVIYRCCSASASSCSGNSSVRGFDVPLVCCCRASDIWRSSSRRSPRCGRFRADGHSRRDPGLDHRLGVGLPRRHPVRPRALPARGLLPLGNLVAALPIVGVAPILVMWFGFDWQSKAAMVVVMTFFPMLVNAVAGLQASAISSAT